MYVCVVLFWGWGGGRMIVSTWMRYLYRRVYNAVKVLGVSFKFEALQPTKERCCYEGNKIGNAIVDMISDVSINGL